MSSNTFTEAVELAYEECWQQGRDILFIQDRDDAPGWDKEAVLSNLNQQWRGARDVLGMLLYADGQVGLRLYPAAIRPVTPDPHQVTLKTLTWALNSGRLTEAEYQEAIGSNHMVRAVVGRLGENFPEGDFDRYDIPALNERPGKRVALR